MILVSTRPALTLPPVLADEGADEVRASLLPRARTCDGSDVLVDGAAVRAVSAAGFGVLVAAALLAHADGAMLVVRGASTALARALEDVRGHPIRLEQSRRQTVRPAVTRRQCKRATVMAWTTTTISSFHSLLSPGADFGLWLWLILGLICLAALALLVA